MRTLVVWLALCLGSGPGGAGPATAPQQQIEVVELTARPAIVTTVRARPEALERALTTAYLKLAGEVARRGLAVEGPPFARYLSRGKAKDATYVVEAGLVVREPPEALSSGIRAIELPAGPAAVLDHHGQRQQLPRAHAALDGWLAANKRTAADARWELYITTPMTTPDPAKQQTRIVAPLAP